jgi:hypothetical protein
METALRRRIYAGQADPSMQAVKEMARLRIEAIKERLLRAPPNEVTGLQGEGVAYATVLKWFNEAMREVAQKTSVDNQ